VELEVLDENGEAASELNTGDALYIRASAVDPSGVI